MNVIARLLNLGDSSNAFGFPNTEQPILMAKNLVCRAPSLCHRCRHDTVPPRAHLIDNVSLTLKKGEKVGVTGVSGSGKSTLLRALLAIQPHTVGEVCVQGRTVTSTSRWFRKLVQYVPQASAASLNPHHRVEDILREPLIGLGKVRQAASLSRSLMAQVELPERLLTQRAGMLSGGQAQRVAIARALIVKPQLLLADEPTSGLDMATRDALLKLLEHLMAEHQMTLLMVSHDLGALMRLCSRGIVMEKGRLVEDRSMPSLIASPSHPVTRQLVTATHAEYSLQ